jgi:exopolyphosphatase / guanosine-5'-triphosphate,3'-diphosphate pyrophosphatase
MSSMRVGVVDVGANTLRLLVADVGPDGVSAVRTDRVQLGLGEDIEDRGAISSERLVAARRMAKKHAATARRLGCSRTVVVVTSPGRQAANADDLLEALAGIRGVTVRVLSAEEEGAFAYRGALAGVEVLPEVVAVCDVGGGSTQLVVGSREEGPAWARSIDIGSLRLTRRALPDDPPKAEAIERARGLVEPMFSALAPPLPQAAFATGGSARALAEVVGRQLGPEELAVALRIVAERPSRRLAKTFDLSQRRARTLAAGALLLTSAQGLIGVPLQVARGGLREGVALSLVEEIVVAA